MPLIEKNFSRVSEEPEPVGPTKLVIASNGMEDVLMWHVGRAAFSMTNSYGTKCDDLCLSGLVDEGIWVCEGTWVTHWNYERTDCDMEFKCTVREPTPEEWQSIMSGSCPWTEEYADVAPEAER